MSGIELISAATMSSVFGEGTAALTLGQAATGLGAVGSVVGAAGSIASGQAQSDAMKYNAGVAQNNAIAAGQAADYDISQQRYKTQRLLSSQGAAFGASGVTPEGSPLEVMGETAANAERDVLTTRYQGQLGVSRNLSQAALDSQYAATYSSSGYFGAATSLLGGAGKLASIQTGKNGAANTGTGKTLLGNDQL